MPKNGSIPSLLFPPATTFLCVVWITNVVCVLDLPVYSESVLPFSGGVAGHSLRSGHRYVEFGMHPGRDAHGRTTVCRLQRGHYIANCYLFCNQTLLRKNNPKVTLQNVIHVLNIHMYQEIYIIFCTCNTPKTPYMYYKCCTIGHVEYSFPW